MRGSFSPVACRLSSRQVEMITRGRSRVFAVRRILLP